jgi:hypothetical protein
MNLNRVGNFLKKWITESYHDFDEDEELKDLYMQIVEGHILQHDKKLGEALIKGFQDKAKGNPKRLSQAIFSDPAPQVIAPKGPITSIVDIHPLELSRQMTLIVIQVIFSCTNI